MSNEEQKEYWNGEAGIRWAEYDEMMASMLQPIAESLLAHADIGHCRTALDVGCGGGSQSLMLAHKLGTEAHVLGVDISEPLLQVARSRAQQEGSATVEFLQADAATHEFAAGTFDLLFSRFGVMFFEDPEAAFRTMHSALRQGAQLAFSCWQSLQDNEWTRLPLAAALQHLPAPPAPNPEAPGPFAFADPRRVNALLTAAGFTDIAIEPSTTQMRFSKTSSLADSVRDLARIGPIGRLLADVDHATRERVYDAMAEALAGNYRDGSLHMEGAIWLVTGSAT